MNLSFERLNVKIEKLQQKKQQLEEGYTASISQLVTKAVRQGADIKLLAGIMLDAMVLVEEFPDKKEAWQTAGQKFLSRRPRTVTKDRQTAVSLSTPEAPAFRKEEANRHGLS